MYTHARTRRTVEVFDVQRGSWSVLAAELRQERKYFAAASLSGRLVAVGGLDEARCRCARARACGARCVEHDACGVDTDCSDAARACGVC
jgi:hypothetical protein